MEYIVIVGGQLHNKGAQAMTFTVVDAMKKKYPNKEIVLFASVYTKRDEEEKLNLNFKVYPWLLRTKLKILSLKEKKYAGIKENIKALVKGAGISNETHKEIVDILTNTSAIIDVSGYALSSQRGEVATINYLYNISIAKKFNIPMYLLPQSFGPFNYKEKKAEIEEFIKENLKYPKKIYVRENDGIQQLGKIGVDKVESSLDTVLQSKDELQVSNLYKIFEPREFEIPNNSVAIIPNEKILKHGNESKLFNIYRDICAELLNNDKKVYLIRHSYEDSYICKKIKEYFPEEKNVILLDEDLNCIEINDLLKKFDYIIASRYHSIIHAYKNSVPSLVIGWAVKYEELLNKFNQEKYLFDVRTDFETDTILASLKQIESNYKEESLKISKKLKELQAEDIFKAV